MNPKTVDLLIAAGGFILSFLFALCVIYYWLIEEDDEGRRGRKK